MPTCPDTCPVVRAQILREQEALKSAAKEAKKDAVPKRPQPINESKSEGTSARPYTESYKSKSTSQTQQMNNNVAQQTLSAPVRSSDKKYQSRYVQQDVQSDEENVSVRSAGTASGKKQREDEQNDSSRVDSQEKSGAASEKVSRATSREDKPDESSSKNIEGRSKAAPATSSRAKQREEINTTKRSDPEFQGKSGSTSREDKPEESSTKNIQGRSKAVPATSSRAKQREEIIITKRSEPEFQGKSGATSREDKPDESSIKKEVFKESIQGRSKAAPATSSRAKKRVETNKTKRSDREFKSIKSEAFSKRETDEEAGPSSGGSSIPQGHSPCAPECPLKRYKELIKRRTEEKQRKLDRYLIRKGFNYFDNLCTCSVICLFNQLSRDPFVRSLIHSAFLFTVGLKLCGELYAWQIPSRATFY